MKNGTIYLLTDGKTFYVGYTERPPVSRFGQHLRDACQKNGAGYNRPLYDWLRRLALSDKMPELKILQRNATKCDEKRWVEHYVKQHGPMCVNIEHHTGRRRANVGQRHGMAKLSDQEVLEILMAFQSWTRDAPVFYRVFAEKYGVDRGTISNIVRRKNRTDIRIPKVCSVVFTGSHAWNVRRGSFHCQEFPEN